MPEQSGMTGYCYLWEFQVKPGLEAEFERHYGASGTWARLFRQSPDYLETLLLKDKSAPQRYLTVDRWRSQAGCQAFRDDFAEQYAQLDQQCEQLTVSERGLGEYAG